MARVTRSGDWSKFKNRIKKVAQNMGKLVKVIQDAAPVIILGMQSRARVDTGFMRDNTVEENIPTGAILHSKASYAGYQEFGTSTITPNLFFRPPLAKGWEEIKKDLFRVMTQK